MNKRKLIIDSIVSERLPVGVGQGVDKLYEEIAELKENGTGGGSGASVQPDWSQNDETAPDYIKGRTHWTEIGEGLSEFNGDLTGKEAIPLDEVTIYVKISDKTPTPEELIGSAFKYTVMLEEVGPLGTHEVILSEANVVSYNGAHMVIIENIEVPLITVLPAPINGIPLSVGTYFSYLPNELCPNALSCLSGPIEVVHRLDPKYLPEGYPYVEVVKGDITFNGDLTGRETFPIVDGVYFVKISEQCMTEQELIGQTITRRANEVVGSVVITEEDLRKEEFDSDNYIIFVGDYVSIIKGDLSSVGVPISEGTWFIYEEAGDYKHYVESLTGLIGDVEKVHQIDKKFIPEGVGMPVVTAEDNGKFLRVVDGQAAWVAIMNAEEATFGE